MEAYSVEDSGYGICFHVYAYNYQPGVLINYKTGESVESYYEDATAGATQNRFVLNVNSKKFHLPECDKTAQIKAENKQTYEGTREDLLFQGFVPAGCCNP
jgi:DNA-entry nuclease